MSLNYILMTSLFIYPFCIVNKLIINHLFSFIILGKFPEGHASVRTLAPTFSSLKVSLVKYAISALAVALLLHRSVDVAIE